MVKALRKLFFSKKHKYKKLTNQSSFTSTDNENKSSGSFTEKENKSSKKPGEPSKETSKRLTDKNNKNCQEVKSSPVKLGNQRKRSKSRHQSMEGRSRALTEVVDVEEIISPLQSPNHHSARRIISPLQSPNHHSARRIISPSQSPNHNSARRIISPSQSPNHNSARRIISPLQSPNHNSARRRAMSDDELRPEIRELKNILLKRTMQEFSMFWNHFNTACLSSVESLNFLPR